MTSCSSKRLYENVQCAPAVCKQLLKRSLGHLQGLAMQRMLLAMADRDGAEACNFDFVMVAGHFLARDENIFTFFEGQQVKPPEHHGTPFTTQCTRPNLAGYLHVDIFCMQWCTVCTCQTPLEPVRLPTGTGRHLQHHQMHHRQGQATLSVLPETLAGAEIATASQLAGANTEPSAPPVNGRRQHRPHNQPPLLHLHHRAYLREQAAQLNTHMQRKSIVSSACSALLLLDSAGSTCPMVSKKTFGAQSSQKHLQAHDKGEPHEQMLHLMFVYIRLPSTSACPLLEQTAFMRQNQIVLRAGPQI